MERFRTYLYRQLGRPSGWGGSLLLRRLNRDNAPMNRLALAQLALQPEQRVLEIGFGGGDLLQRLLADPRRLRLTGIDPAPAAIALSQRRFRRAIARQQLTLHSAAAEAIPGADCSFDTIVTVNTLYFWSDVAAVLGECQRVLQPGGRLAIAYTAKAFLEQRQMTQHGFQAYDPSDVEQYLQNFGFTAIQTATGTSAADKLFFCTRGLAQQQ